VVSEIMKEAGITPDGKAVLDEAGMKLAKLVSDKAAPMIDALNKGEVLKLPPFGEGVCKVSRKGKIAVVPCTGMGQILGTGSRLSGYEAEKKNLDATFLCTPSIYAGNGGVDVAAGEMPRICIDGCKEKCGKKAVEKVGGKVVSHIFIPRVMKEKKLAMAENRVKFGPDGEKLAKAIADSIESEVKKHST
jgi:uncharacterized metal-binding protein